MVRHHYDEFLLGRPGYDELKQNTYELCEFLTDVLQVDRLTGRFPYKVGLHQSCHGLRELRLASSSELVVESYNKVQSLLECLEGIDLVSLDRPDECCGLEKSASRLEWREHRV